MIFFFSIVSHKLYSTALAGHPIREKQLTLFQQNKKCFGNMDFYERCLEGQNTFYGFCHVEYNVNLVLSGSIN